MRTVSPETLRALRRAIGSTPYSRWAKAAGIAPMTVHAALNGKSMSARRENNLRAALSLPLIRTQLVELTEGQRVVTVSPVRKSVRRASSMSPCKAMWLDSMARELNYRSAGQMLLEEFCQTHSYTPCNCVVRDFDDENVSMNGSHMKQARAGK